MTALRSSPIDSSSSSPPPKHTEQLPTSREVGLVDVRTEPRRPWVHFIAGATGGMTSTFITSPLDVVKTRLQSDFYKQQLEARRAATGVDITSGGLLRQGVRHFKETLQILQNVYRIEGWRGLFKGLGPNLSGVVPARAINFYTYGNGKRIIADHFNGGEESPLVHLCAAACAGIATSTATNPIWLVKTRLQLDKEKAGTGGKTRQYKNSFDCVQQVARKEGIRGLYRGLSASYLGATESTIQWVLYEKMKSYLQRRRERSTADGQTLSPWDGFVDNAGKPVAAGAAKLFAAALTYPHEVVRTRMRVKPMADGRLKYTGLAQCFRLVWKEEGMMGLYGGLSPHLMRVVPSAAIMFGVYETVLRLLGESV